VTRRLGRITKLVRKAARTKRPNEVGTLGGSAALITLLVAFGVDPVKALAISGVISPLLPGIITALVDRIRGR
jgi:hypothetical protein